MFDEVAGKLMLALEELGQYTQTQTSPTQTRSKCMVASLHSQDSWIFSPENNTFQAAALITIGPIQRTDYYLESSLQHSIRAQQAMSCQDCICPE